MIIYEKSIEVSDSLGWGVVWYGRKREGFGIMWIWILVLNLLFIICES